MLIKVLNFQFFFLLAQWKILQVQLLLRMLEVQLFIFTCVHVSGKSQVMGEIKIALKKEMKTEGEHLVLEILQCRNITYKFKSPDHLPGKGKEKIKKKHVQTSL